MADGKIVYQVSLNTKPAEEKQKEFENKAKDSKAPGLFHEVWVGACRKIGEAFVELSAKAVGALIGIGKQAVENYAEFEQLEGGVKKLFGKTEEEIEDFRASLEAQGLTAEEVAAHMETYGKANERVMANARAAYNTAGMSANEYMETVTSFSASLINGLQGDTAKAADLADVAIRDMSDNINTFGTDAEAVKNAYMGFAKGNFTMLDNLKLGYGGTATEMLRLVKEAGVVSESVESINEVSFDQIIDAIHITQQRLKITGTTAKEASTTIQGSIGAMKAAWQNMLTGMADENADFEQLTADLMNTLITPDGQGGVIGSLIPRISQTIAGIGNALTTLLPQLIQMLVPVILENVPVLVDAVQATIQAILALLPDVIAFMAELIPQIVATLMEMLPLLLEVGIQGIVTLIQGLTDAIPQLIAMLPTIIDTIVGVLLDNIDLVLETGINLLLALIYGLVDAIPRLIAMVPKIIQTIVEVLLNNLPLIITAAIQIMIALITGLIQAIPDLLMALPKIFKAIIEAFRNVNWGDIGTNLMDGIKNGVLNAVQGLWNAAINAVKKVWQGVKDFLGISSPSKLFEKTIGVQMIAGQIEGVEDETPELVKQTVEAQEKAYEAAIDYTVPTGDQLTRELSANMSMAQTMTVERTINVPLFLDGREIARATAWDMGEQLAWEAR